MQLHSETLDLHHEYRVLLNSTQIHAWEAVDNTAGWVDVWEGDTETGVGTVVRHTGHVVIHVLPKRRR
jgi:hypothetical protein